MSVYATYLLRDGRQMTKQNQNCESIFDGNPVKDDSLVIDPGEATDDRDLLGELLSGCEIRYQHQPGDIRSLELSEIVQEVISNNPQFSIAIYGDYTHRKRAINPLFIFNVEMLAAKKISEIMPLIIFNGED